MKTQHLIISCALLALTVSCNSSGDNTAAAHLQHTDVLFPKGEEVTNANFTGKTWLKTLVEADSLNENSVGNVTFEPGSRTKWHLHPGGQILLATGGTGYYQEKGSPVKILHKGDVIKCPPNVVHWHGASPQQEFVQIAITTRAGGPTKWFEEVIDQEYHAEAK